MTSNPQDFDTGPYRHFSLPERVGMNLGNSDHFAKRHLGMCDRNILTTESQCSIVNEFLGRCVCVRDGIRCCSGRTAEEEYCFACLIFCQRNRLPERKNMLEAKLGRVAKAAVAAGVSVFSIFATLIFSDPGQAEIVMSSITAILVTFGVYQVPNKG